MSEMTQTEKFERNRAIQEMVNSFLKDNHMPTITEMMAKSDKREVLGILTPTHKIVLQQMIRHEYPDIDARIRNARNSSDGRGQILGVLSSTEAALVDELLEKYRSTQVVIPDTLVQTRLH